jgi:cytochrome c oxidase assembly protein subunit 15
VWTLRGTPDSRVRFTTAALAAAVLAQAVLGIATLLAQVPLALGLAHQAGAAAVFGVAVWHLHALRHPRRQMRPAP